MSTDLSKCTNRGIGTGLFLIILASVFPVATVLTAKVSIPFMIAVAAGYAVQLSIFVYMIVRYQIQLKDPWIRIAFVYTILQLITLVFTSLLQGTYEPMDLVNSLAKPIGVLIFAGLFQCLFPTENDIRRFLLLFLWLTGFAILANMIINGSDFPKIFTVSSSYGLDFSSFLANRNQFGFFLFLSIVAHALFLYERRLGLVNVILFLGQILSLLLTMSRGSILATILFVFSIAVVQFIRRPLYLIYFVGSVALTLYVIRSTEMNEIFERVFFRSDTGLAGRDSLWQTGLEIWRDHNIFFGVGTFRGLDIAREMGMNFNEFHSFMVETLVSGGIVEMAVLVGIFGVVWRQVASSRLDPYRRGILFSMAVGVFALSFVESISFFTIGLVGTLFSAFVVTLPILYANLSNSAEPSVFFIERRECHHL